MYWLGFKQLRIKLKNIVFESMDVTALFREVQALRAALDEHSIMSIADSSGKIIDVNTGFCRISGYFSRC